MADDELEAIRDRIGDSQAQTGADVLTLLAEVFRLRALVGEPEWEYAAYVPALGGGPYSWGPLSAALAVRDNPDVFRKWTHGNPVTILRRRPAGDPEPVPETGDDQ